MKLRKHIRNQKGFTLIEIRRRFGYPGNSCGHRYPEVSGYENGSGIKGAAAATMELNARERLSLHSGN